MTKRLPEVGARVGDYVLERALGRGAMGAVFLGRHVELGTERAVKVMLGGGRPSTTALERFQREARALAKVDHRGVIRIHTAGVHEDLAYLVLDLVDGGDLDRALRGGPLPVARALRLGAAVADALACLHAAGIVHRDLKPGNVLLRAQDDAPVLTDFGIARDESEERLTASRALVGSPQFMAPEQITGDRASVGPPSDVFALGVVLYLMLTGAPPFEGDTLHELTNQLVSVDPPPPSRARPGLTRDVDAVVLAALHKSPARRPDAARLARALRAVAAGERPEIERASSVGRVWRRTPRAVRRALAAALLASTLAGGALLVVQVAVVAPRAAAARALGEARELDARLSRWQLGVTGAPAPASRDELLARAEALRAAGPRLPAGDQGGAVALAPRLEAAARLLDPGAEAPRGRAGRSALELAVDALLLERAGDARAALARAEAAVAADAALAPARLLALRLRARLDPRSFLAAARGLPPGPERDFAAGLALEPARGLYLAALRAAPAAASRDDARRELDAVAGAARELGVSLEALAAEKAALLEAEAPAWEAVLQGALRRGAELDALLRLGAALSADPPLPPGPRLRAAVDALLGGVHDAYDAAHARGDRRETGRQLARALQAEATAFYEVDPGRAPPPRLALLVDRAYLVDESWHGETATDLVLAALRTSTVQPSRTVTSRATMAELAQRLHLRPRSRALRFAVALCELRDHPIAWGDAEAVARSAERVEDALAPGLLEDLAPVYVGEAWLLLAGLQPWLRATRGRAACERQLEAATRACALLRMPEHLKDAFGGRIDALRTLSRPDEALRAAEECVAFFRPRVEGVEGTLVDNERHALVVGLTLRGELEEALERRDEALRDGEEALRVQATTATGHDAAARVLVSRLSRASGDLTRACEVTLGLGAARLAELCEDSPHFAVEAARVCLAQADPARARELVTIAAARSPDDAHLRQFTQEQGW